LFGGVTHVDLVGKLKRNYGITEIWHYGSHGLFHLKRFHWMHAEHHKSHLNSPFTAISFSFSEKLVFNLGIMVFMALLDVVVSVNFLRRCRLVYRISGDQFL